MIPLRLQAGSMASLVLLPRSYLTESNHIFAFSKHINGYRYTDFDNQNFVLKSVLIK
jgi:hypothetical protein